MTLHITLPDVPLLNTGARCGPCRCKQSPTPHCSRYLLAQDVTTIDLLRWDTILGMFGASRGVDNVVWYCMVQWASR
jgi:hypothetical protein